MARAMRPEYPGAIWHLMSHGNKCDVFRTDADRRLFLELIGQASRRFG